MGAPAGYWGQFVYDLMEAARPIPPAELSEALHREAIKERIANARQELLEAMKVADCLEDRDLHRRLGYEVLNLDDLKAIAEEQS